MPSYAAQRHEIKSGDLLAWSHRKWGSLYDIKIQAVRLFTMSEYSHVGIAWVVSGRVFVIEAVEPMVRIYPLSKLGSFYHIPLGAEWSPDTEAAAISHVGAEYRQLEAIEMYFRDWKPGVVSECAALVLEVCAQGGIYLGRRATPDAVVREAQRLGHPTYYLEN
jgi:hypothetical protein